jgi:hypothetical protein
MSLRTDSVETKATLQTIAHPEDPILNQFQLFFGLSGLLWSDVAKRFRDSDSHVVIVTLPDPIASQVGYVFDHARDAIEVAATENGYVLERSYLPWAQNRRDPNSAEKTSVWDLSLQHRTDPTLPGEGTQLQLRTAVESEGVGHHPGALIFSRLLKGSQIDRDANGVRSRLLLVLLVGETPTSGVDPEALHQALKISGDLDVAPQNGCRRIRLVAPFFSGSARSLSANLSSWNQVPSAAVSFELISGSAVMDDLPQILRFKSTECGEIDFHGTTWPQGHTNASFRRKFLQPHGSTLENTVLLIEAGTVYGESSNQLQLEKSDEQRIANRVLRYPLHIAQLREAYMREGILSAGSYRTLNAEARSALHAPFEPSSDASDPPKPFHPQESAATSEEELTTLLRSLDRDRIRFIGILGTDVEDRILIAHLVRRHVPDAQLFTFLSDLAYIHPEHTSDLLGMWVVSTYPLVPSNERWLSSKVPLLQFASGSTQGVYNAFVATLSGFGEIGAEEQLAGFGSPDTGTGLPPLWVSVVGRGAFWPLEWLSRDPHDTQSVLWSSRKSSGEIGSAELTDALGFRLLLAIASVLLLALAGAYFVKSGSLRNRWAALISDEIDGRFPDLAWLLTNTAGKTCLEAKLQTARLALFFSIVFFGFGYAAWLAAPALIFTFRYDLVEAGRIVKFAETVQALLASLASVALLSAIADSSLSLISRRDRWKRVRRLSSLGAATLVFGLALRNCVAAHPAELVRRLLRYERAADLSSGLSPLLPVTFLCAAALTMLLADARRRRLLESVVDPTKMATGSSVLKASLTTSEAAIRGRPIGVFAKGPLAAGVLVTAFVLAVSDLRSSRTIDAFSIFKHQATFDILLILLLGSLAGVLTAIEIRFLLVWRGLSGSLRVLSASPLETAFGRLPRKMARSFGLRLSVTPPEVVELRYSADQLAMLAHRLKQGQAPSSLKDLGGALVDEATAIQKLCDAEASEAETHTWKTFAFQASTRAKLAEAAGEVLRALERSWQDNAGADVKWEGLGPRTTLERGINPVGMMERDRERLDNNDDYSVHLAEDFVAAEATRYISYVFAHMRNLLGSATAGGVLVLLAIASYPIQPQQLLMRWALVGLLVLIAIFLVVLVQSDRDVVLSKIADRTPGRVNFDATFVAQAATFGGIPLLTILATQFPAFEQQLWSVVSWFSR